MAPTISGALRSPKIWGAKNIKFWTTFSATFALDTAYLGTKRRMDKQKS